MANGGFRWRFEVKQMLKLVRVTGIATTVDKDNQALLILRGLQFLTLAEKKKGVVLPLTSFPQTRENEESIYFEILFHIDLDIQDFLKNVKNGPY